jgi:uncharacterized protein YndB with AHSA1/START domain
VTSSAGVILTERELPFARPVVFEAFSNPDALAVWWGPEGFRNVFEEFSFIPGGSWRFTMHAPDGLATPNECQFTKIVRPEMIQFHHFGPDHEYRATFVFAERDVRTLLSWEMVHSKQEQGEQLRSLLESANEANLDRLEQYLNAPKNPASPRSKISRLT